MTALLDAIRSLAPELGPRAAKTYADGRLGDDVLAALAKTGLFDGNLTADGALEITRELAQHCASTAWITAAASLGGAGLMALGPQAKDLKTSDDLATWADRAERATLTPDGDSFRFSGTWRTVPGATQAKVFLLRIDIDRAVAVPATQGRVTLLEHQAGLRGANLGDVTVDNVVVPRGCVLTLSGPLARFAAVAPLGVVLGAAEGGYREYVASTKKRMSTVGGAAVAKLPQVHVRLAEAEAELDSARTMFAGVVRALACDESSTAGFNTAESTTALARDATFIARQCHRALTLLVQQMGAVGLLETNVVQRFARDLRAAVADHRLAWDPHMAARGRTLLGVTDDKTDTETVAV